MFGQHKRNINVVPYQSEWIELYQKEAELLMDALGEIALHIEHIGSTAIPGMVAKPVIDMMVAIESFDQASEYIPILAELGYEYRAPDTVPERMFFAKECCPEVRTHHLNLSPLTSEFWKNQLAFRDYLRMHPQVALEYGDIKVNLAETYAQSKFLDREGKTEFVTKVLALAQNEFGE
jgi:GrpB-like predicted nucleotidyltransferase (UPF0157 family)